MSCAEDLPKNENPEPASGENYTWALKQVSHLSVDKPQQLSLNWQKYFLIS